MRILILLLLLTGCSAGSAEQSDLSANLQSVQSGFDEAAAAEPQDAPERPATQPDTAEADPANVDPDDVEEPSFACTQDCSGHDAGFAWARDHDITDESECGGNSQSFIEGCEGFAEQRQEQAEEDVADQTADTEDPVDNEDQ